MKFEIVLIGNFFLAFMLIGNTIQDSLKIKKSVHDSEVKETLDVQESRDRENKLAQYCQALEYEISVLSGREKKND